MTNPEEKTVLTIEFGGPAGTKVMINGTPVGLLQELDIRLWLEGDVEKQSFHAKQTKVSDSGQVLRGETEGFGDIQAFIKGIASASARIATNPNPFESFHT